MTALPKWVTHRKDGVFVVDPDIAYPAVLKALGLGGKPDQYQLETAYQCVKMKVQELAEAAGHDPKKPLIIHIAGGGTAKKSWALSAHPRGRGSEAATQGREARVHFERVRGQI
jgi:hypothetical protein